MGDQFQVGVGVRQDLLGCGRRTVHALGDEARPAGNMSAMTASSRSSRDLKYW
ncbi:hypothetical protein ACFQZ4_02405 [Catellatospora coxensis]